MLISNAQFTLRQTNRMNSPVIRKIVLFAFLASNLACSPKEATEGEGITTIAFGSCSRQSSPQEMWPFVLNQQPDLWIWLGDNIYGDSEDMTVLKAKYDQQKSEPNYQKLRNSTEIIGIWDDHDYGVNDGGKEFPKKAESRDLMFEFLDVPANSPARQREGGYQSYTYGTRDKKVKVLLLDARYFRDSIARVDREYIPNATGDVLGEAQWAWLEKELTDSDAAIHILAGGIQLIPEEHPYEKWANLPTARQRLLDLISKTQPSRTFYISGDRHIAEISKMELPGYGNFYDFTSSGLTHTWRNPGEEPNRYRVGDLIIEKNFGLIQLDWSGKEVIVTFQVRGLNDQVFLEHKPTF